MFSNFFKIDLFSRKFQYCFMAAYKDDTMQCDLKRAKAFAFKQNFGFKTSNRKLCAFGLDPICM